MLYADLGRCAFVAVPGSSALSMSFPTFSVGSGVLDTGIVLLLLIGGVQGYLRGGVRQVTGLAGWLLGVTAGLKYMDGFGKGVQGVVTFPDEMVGVVGFAAAFLLVRIIAYSAGTAALIALGWMGLRIVDRVAGGALGGLKSGLTLSLFLTVAGYVGLPGDVAQTESRFYDEVKALMPWTYGVTRGLLPDIDPLRAVPHQITDVFNRSFLSGIGEEAQERTISGFAQTRDILGGATRSVRGRTDADEGGEAVAERLDRLRSPGLIGNQATIDLLPSLIPYPSTEIRNGAFAEWMEGGLERSWATSMNSDDAYDPQRKDADIWGTSRPGFQERAWRHENR